MIATPDSQVEKIGCMVEINHEGSWWDELKGEVVGVSEYGTLCVQIGSSDWRRGIWPFLPQEVRFINRNGGQQCDSES